MAYPAEKKVRIPRVRRSRTWVRKDFADPALSVRTRMSVPCRWASGICARASVPGLHVYELPVEHREEGDGVANPWRLGHHSGKALAAFPSQDDALRAAREVADLTNWTRSAEDLRTDADLDLEEYVDRMETRTNGLFITPRKKLAL
jgi:hypothetical protein